MWQDKLKEVIYILENSNVNEIDLTFWGRRFRVVKKASLSMDTELSPALDTITTPEVLDSESDEPIVPESSNSGEQILSPMPGTYYSSSSPDSAPFINEGDTVVEGDTLCIIEAMKIMNEIEAEKSGTIEKILVKNGQSVDYDQPLFSINPS